MDNLPLTKEEIDEFFVDLRQDFDRIYLTSFRAARQLGEENPFLQPGYLLARFALLRLAQDRRPLDTANKRFFETLSRLV